MSIMNANYTQLLHQLLEISSVSPMESGVVSEIPRAQAALESFARGSPFFETLYSREISPRDIEGAPQKVVEIAQKMGQPFFSSQRNVVLRVGHRQPRDRTIMFNFHVDTVGGEIAPPSENATQVFGRGAVDAKGPGVAAMAGIEAALREYPSISDHVQILVQSVCGEEGGAMGYYGTRLLMNEGLYGALNVFAEPTAGVFFDCTTTSMTAEIRVQGMGSTDDAPALGDNATVILGFLAQALLHRCASIIEQEGGKLCIAGLHTGSMHNRVYGEGTLLINMAYPSVAAGDRFRSLLEQQFETSLDFLRREFAGYLLMQKSLSDLSRTTQLRWLKRGLPVLQNRNTHFEQMLSRELEMPRNPEHCIDRAFTCDALWGARSDCYTIVCGPGDLGENGAHSSREYVEKSELEAYAHFVKRLVIAFSHSALQRTEVDQGDKTVSVARGGES